jgi:hypothetical protein
MTKRKIQYQIFESLSPKGKGLFLREMKIKFALGKKGLKNLTLNSSCLP